MNHQLEKSAYDQCHACRLPITEEDKQSALYRKGASCPHCHGKHSAEQLARFEEREKQISLAQQRGEEHIGGSVSEAIKHNKQRKQEALLAHKARSESGADGAS